MRPLALCAAAVLLVSGCGVVGIGDEEQPAETSSTSEAAPDGSSSSDEGSSGSGAGVADADLEDVLVEQTVQLAGSPEDSLTIGVRSLVVDGPTMTLELVLTPDFATASDTEVVSLYDAWERDVFLPTLLDRPHLTEYSVITDDASQGWSSDAVSTGALNGSPFLVYAVFAAPQDEVETVELRLRDVWPVFTDVPVTT